MFNLAHDKGILNNRYAPNIKVEMLDKPEPREGFVLYKEFQRLVAGLLEHIRNVAVVAYNTGMRKGELLNLKWRNVDLREEVIRLRPEETKNKTGRLIPLEEESPQGAEVAAQEQPIET